MYIYIHIYIYISIGLTRVPFFLQQLTLPPPRDMPHRSRPEHAHPLSTINLGLHSYCSIAQSHSLFNY